MPSLVVVPATPEDLPSVAALYFAANAQDAYFSAIYPRGGTRAAVAYMTARLEQTMDEDDSAHILTVKDAMTREIVAYGVWHFVPAQSQERMDQEMLRQDYTFPADASAGLGRRLIQASVRKRCEVVTQNVGMGTPYAYISTLATSIKYRRQGAASKILDWGMDRVDEFQLSVYVESTPAALRLYAKHGFQEIDTILLDLGGTTATHSCLVRTPAVP